MSGIFWVIIVGFVAGIIARCYRRARTIRGASSSPPCSASPARFSRPLSARLSAITAPTRAPALSPRRSAHDGAVHLEPAGGAPDDLDPGAK